MRREVGPPRPARAFDLKAFGIILLVLGALLLGKYTEYLHRRGEIAALTKQVRACEAPPSVWGAEAW